MKKLIVRYKLKLIFFIGIILLFGFLFRPFQNNLFNFRFFDEDDNFITGKWILQEKKLHDNLFFQHQPLTSLISATVQGLTKPNTTFLLVKRHREFVYFFFLVAWLALIARFGSVALFTAIIFELTKHSLMGTLFLAEVLVIPAVLYLILLMYEIALGCKIRKIDYWLIPVSLLFIQFNLLPLTPFVLFSAGYLFWNLRRYWKKILLPVLISIVVTFVLFSRTISFPGYIQDTIFSNITDFMPYVAKHSFGQGVYYIFLKPVEILFLPFEGFNLILFIINLFYISTLISLAVRRQWKLVALTFLLLPLLNARPQAIGSGYSGFHLLPWYVGFSLLTLLNARFLYGKGRGTRFMSIFFSIVLLAAVFRHGLAEYVQNPNPFDRWYVNYSVSFDYAEAIRIIRKKNDKLLTVPNGSLIYWQAGIEPSSRFFFVYPFIYHSKRLSSQLRDDFKSSPPAFVYIEGGVSPQSFFKELMRNYIPILKDENESSLFIEKSRLEQITERQWKEINRYGFSSPLAT